MVAALQKRNAVHRVLGRHYPNGFGFGFGFGLGLGLEAFCVLCWDFRLL
jgi:hypothetical protein